MKKKLVWLLLICNVHFTFHASTNLSIEVGARRHAKMKVMLVTIGENSLLKECSNTIKRDFLFSGQLDVSVEHCNVIPSKKKCQEWQKQGSLIAIFLNVRDDETFEWRIYDMSKIKMVKGKCYKKRGTEIRMWAHNMADMIWPELMGQESSFSTKIAYSEAIISEGGRRSRHIYIADYDGSHPQPLITTPTVNVAPRWNRDLDCPLLFYSESSKANISLRVTMMNGLRKVASNFDGLNMLPTFSKDGKKVVYCISHGDGMCQLYSYENGQLQQLTHNKGNNISPTLSADGNSIFFCSDYKNNVPLIYHYDRTTEIVEPIATSGPCFSPSYSEKNKKLAYIKRIDGVMQIFLYDLHTKKHTQYTSDIIYHKEECSWSPCGNYLLFCLVSGPTSKLAIENISTHERHIITGSNQHCSYPDWSPLYRNFPVVC